MRLRFDYIHLDKIDISLSNVRKSQLEKDIDGLASSIEEIGLQQPVVVFKKHDGRFELIIGQRRYLACKKLGIDKIPSLITTVRNETDAIIKSFSENIHRLDLEYKDKMQGATILLDRLGSIDKVAVHLGVSTQTIRNYLGYAAVPDPIKRLVDEKKLSASTAIRIVKKIPDEQQSIKIAKLVQEEPRSKNRGIIIDVAEENPDKSSSAIAKIAHRKAQMRKIIIHVTERVYEATINASKEYLNEKEDVVKEALEEWLKEKGFLK